MGIGRRSGNGRNVQTFAKLGGGTNYAFGGATTGPVMSGFPFSLLTQANQYLSTTPSPPMRFTSSPAVAMMPARRLARSQRAGGVPGTDGNGNGSAIRSQRRRDRGRASSRRRAAHHCLEHAKSRAGACGRGGGRFRIGKFLAGSMNAALAARAGGQVRRHDLRHFRSGYVDRTQSGSVWFYERDRCLRGTCCREL